MNEKTKKGGRRKVCPFLGRTSSEPTETGTLTRTWFPPCIGESCAAYVRTGDARALCARMGTEVTKKEQDRWIEDFSSPEHDPENHEAPAL